MKLFISMCFGLTAAAGLFLSQPAYANEFPTKPVRLIVPFAPGGGTDVTVRLVQSEVSSRLGQQLVIENRPGAGGAIGAEYVARSSPDGYTLVVYASTGSIDPSYRPHLSYRFDRDFVPITSVASAPYMIVVNPELPFHTLEDLIAYAKDNPGELNFGTPGVGTIAHLGAELLKVRAGIDITHVPYRGSGPVIVAVMSGEAHLSLETPVQIRELVNTGQLRALAVTSKTRSPIFPEVPTVEESGVSDYELITWFGIFTPADTPPAVVETLYEAFSGAAKSENVSTLLRESAMEVDAITPAQFKERLDVEIPMWAKVINDANIQPER